jgi:hypothetical protein
MGARGRTAAGRLRVSAGSAGLSGPLCGRLRVASGDRGFHKASTATHDLPPSVASPRRAMRKRDARSGALSLFVQSGSAGLGFSTRSLAREQETRPLQ